MTTIEAPARLDIAEHTRWIREGVFWHVLVRGEDVTDRCEYAEAGPEGYASCLVRGEDGHVLAAADGSGVPQRVILRGDVTFVAHQVVNGHESGEVIP